MAIVYKNIILETLEKNANRFVGIAFVNAERAFDNQKDSLLVNEFENHPVTEEIRDGPSKESSDILPEGYGNLYAFLGFYQGDDVLTPVKEILLERTKITRTGTLTKRRGNFITFSFPINEPTLKDFDQEGLNPPDWGSKSWVRYIEEGVPNFAYFIHKRKGARGSRSGYGLEIKRKLRSLNRIPPIKYISEILKGFFDNFQSR